MVVAPKQVGGDDLPLNEKLRLKTPSGKLQLVPRSYQAELCQKALEGNVIIYLGTGLGKTFITVLYMNSAQVAAQVSNGRKVVFLAPTQDLIKQQAEYINSHTDLRVKIFCGRTARCGEHIDHWNINTWKLELDKVDVLFMTPQIFNAAVSTDLLAWPKFAALIFDEFHHACKIKTKMSGHPYMQILRHYEVYYSGRPDEPRPRMIGMTASLLNNMPKDRDAIRDQVSHLERILHAKCITDIDVQEKRPTMLIHSFAQKDDKHDLMSRILSHLIMRIKDALKTDKANRISSTGGRSLTAEEVRILAFTNRLRLSAAGFSIKPSSIPKVFEGLLMIYRRCGLWALRCVCEKLIVAVDRHSVSSVLTAEVKPIYQYFSQILREIQRTLQVFLEMDKQGGLLAYTEAKSLSLLDMLLNEYNRAAKEPNGRANFSCVIFVQSRLEVVALCEWVQQVSRMVEDYKFIHCDYAIGLAAAVNSKYSCITKRKSVDQHRMLSDFRKGHLNVIVTTSVLEEGIDLPVCSTVVRYNRAKNFREFVQSRGRARQSVSSFVTMCERDKVEDLQKDLNKFYDFEQTLKETLKDRDIRPIVRKGQSTGAHRVATSNGANMEDEDDVFITKNNTVLISAPTAKTILHMYCSRLAKNTPFAGDIRYELDELGASRFQATLLLPAGCPLREPIKGNVKSSRESAINSSVVAAVRALCEAGELDEHGVPTRLTEETVDKLLADCGLAPNFDPLDRSLEGEIEQSSELVTHFFEPKVLNLSNRRLTRLTGAGKLKLIRIGYTESKDVRANTSVFFRRPSLAIIVDARLSEDFLPSILRSHYGLFEVHAEVIDNNLTLSTREHTECLNYTHKLLTKCLSLSPLKREELREKCLAYIVPLSDRKTLDYERMRDSFFLADRLLQVGDIVRVRYHYRQNASTRLNNSASVDGSANLLLVRAVHLDMNPNSPIPGTAQRTFLSDANSKFGDGIVLDLRQPVIEVMPISRQFAQVKRNGGPANSKLRPERLTESLYYLDQFLELMHDDADCVFQAHMLPEIIYRVNQFTVASELELKFKLETKSRRDEGEEQAQQAEQEMDEEDGRQLTDIEVKGDQDTNMSDSANSDDDDDAASSSSAIGGGETDLDEDLDEDQGDVTRVGPQYRDMIGQRAVDLNHDGGNDFDDWDLSAYEPENLMKLTYQFRDSSHLPLSLDNDPNFISHFALMESKVDCLGDLLVQSVATIECRLTSDSTFTDEDDQFAKRAALVDRSITPKLHFDRNSTPIRVCGSQRAWLEAITQRKALESYNLEQVENIGDSYLKYVVSFVLYKNLQGNEGFLTSARSRLTSNKHFCHLAKRSRMGNYAITHPFTKMLLLHALGKPITSADRRELSNRMRPKDLADTFESIVGANLLHAGEYEAILSADWLGLNIFKPELFSELHERAVVFARCPSALAEEFQLADPGGTYAAHRKRMGEFERILGYQFNDCSYLVQAFSHASYPIKCTRSYERLEFLGDAILDFLVTVSLADAKPDSGPGELSASRSALVNNGAFARLALQYKYDLFIQHSSHELYDELVRVRTSMDEDKTLEFLDINDFDKVVKLLGDVFESVAGAIYLDSGNSLDTVWSIYYPMMRESIEQELKQPTKNPLSLLYEAFPGKDRISFSCYDIKTSDGDTIGVTCKIEGFGSFDGRGLTNRQAKVRAVREALKKVPSAGERRKLDEEFRRSHPHILPRSQTRSRSQNQARGGHNRAPSRAGSSSTHNHSHQRAPHQQIRPATRDRSQSGAPRSGRSDVSQNWRRQ